MGASDSIMTAGTEMAVLVPEIWSKRYYDVLLAELPFASVVSKDYEGEIQALGDTVRISTFPEFSDATELAEDADNDADSITVTQQSLVINKRIVKDFIVTNLAQLQSLPAMDKLRELAVYAIMKKIQSIIVSEVLPSTSAPDHTIAYDNSSTLALADMLEVKELLDAQDVPMSDRHAVMGSAQANDIFNITGFTSSDFLLAGSPLTTGEISQKLLGFMPHMTTEVGNTSYWFHSSFYTMAAQQGLSIKVYDLGVDGKRAARVNVDTLCGFKQLDNKRVCTLG
jgi:hypothetical protein